ncbi:MAG: hypothetical protein ACQKBV_14030, partial [Puniceicoccales bacterium]
MQKVFFTNDPETAWQQAAAPWFTALVQDAWRQEKPVVFLAPDSSHIGWVKRQLVLSSTPALGIEFWTPGVLRSHLRATLGDTRPLAVREDLRLIMELAAASLPGNPIAQAATLDPSDFLQLCDQLDAAGWGPDAFSNADAAELATRFYEHLEAAKLITSARADRDLARQLRDHEPPLAQVFAMGFGPGHADALTLLRLLPDAADSLALCALTGDIGVDDQLWRDTLETLGESANLREIETERPLRPIADAAEQHERAQADAWPEVILAPTVTLEARVIVEQIQATLTRSAPGERIGVVFARGGLPLTRETARLLCDAELAHQDEVGHQPGRTPAQIVFEAWRDYQERADADAARAFFRALQRAGRIDAQAESR